MNPLMNNTKWEELRLAMYELDRTPQWSVLTTSGYRSHPDREWFYHFRVGGYDDIVHVDIVAEDTAHRESIRAAILKIHLPGEETEGGFRIIGYAQPGQMVDYL